MAAILWLDRERRYFISSASNSLPASSALRTRWRQEGDYATQVELNVSQPNAVELYYLICSRIDRHNRCRQSDFNIEKKLRTQSWAFRLNSSLLAMIIVDSWLR